MPHPRKPRMIAFAMTEGDYWTKWTPNTHTTVGVRALLFSDGSIWDMYFGWRPRSSWYTQLRIRQLRNKWRNDAKR